MTADHPKRKNYLIKKRFQFRYTLTIVITLLVVMLVSGIGLYMGIWGSVIDNFSRYRVMQNLEVAKRIVGYEDARYRKGDYRLENINREAELLSQKDQDVLRSALASTNRSLVPKVLILAVFIFAGGIFLSHKMAGPIYRIERSAAAIHDGDLRVNFKTRKGDQIKEVTNTLESMVESLRDDINRLKASTINLEERINVVSRNISSEEMDRMRAIIKEIDTVLAKYKT